MSDKKKVVKNIFDNYKIHAEFDIDCLMLNIYIIAKDINGKRFICKPMQLEFEEMPPLEELYRNFLKPAMRLNKYQHKPFLQAMVDVCDKHNIYPSKKPIAKDELKVTKERFEDMKKLALDNQEVILDLVRKNIINK